MALQAEEDARCGRCGEPLDESTNPANENAYRARLITCFSCAVIDKERDEIAGETTGPGLQIHIDKT